MESNRSLSPERRSLSRRNAGRFHVSSTGRIQRNTQFAEKQRMHLAGEKLSIVCPYFLDLLCRIKRFAWKGFPITDKPRLSSGGVCFSSSCEGQGTRKGIIAAPSPAEKPSHCYIPAPRTASASPATPGEVPQAAAPGCRECSTGRAPRGRRTRSFPRRSG